MIIFELPPDLAFSAPPSLLPSGHFFVPQRLLGLQQPTNITHLHKCKQLMTRQVSMHRNYFGIKCNHVFYKL